MANENNNSNKQRNQSKTRKNYRYRNGYRGKQNNYKQQETIEIPLVYAQALMRQATYDPQNASSRKSRSYSVYDKESIIKWLQSPTNSSSEKSLRDASGYMYISSMHYNRLLNYYAGLYTGAYVVSPLGFSDKVDREKFVKEYQKVSNELELMNVPLSLQMITLTALREGAFYGVWLSDNKSAFIMKIDPDYCKITSICDGSYLYKVDMTKISNKLQYYPSQFSKMYEDYVKTGEQWQEVPIEDSICVKADCTLDDCTIPPFAAVMPSLYTIANVESLQETATELKNYKMVSGKVPLTDKGYPAMPEDVVLTYQSRLDKAVGENVGVALTPFDLKTFGFENGGAISSVDDLSNSVANFWSTAGTSGLLHGRENDTTGVAKLAIKNDETYVYGMLLQFERIINRRLKSKFSSTVPFKINILPITVFNREEYLKYYKESVAFGIGKSQYAAALGIPQHDIAGLTYMESEVIPFDKLLPLKSSYNSSGEGDAGRPQSADGELDDAGEKTRDGETNGDR